MGTSQRELISRTGQQGTKKCHESPQAIAARTPNRADAHAIPPLK
ncbi:Hypothetical protein AA314_06276 [Archangium gephyra]|uniref:Uncharacterized protein n=1 Tax=Archangium gephyra TaxID=48 RepID=A0AAC8TGA5_9BACT|nr:Hypothetical protein AA314_06276 [Archangium gephyra]